MNEVMRMAVQQQRPSDAQSAAQRWLSGQPRPMAAAWLGMPRPRASCHSSMLKWLKVAVDAAFWWAMPWRCSARM